MRAATGCAFRRTARKFSVTCTECTTRFDPGNDGIATDNTDSRGSGHPGKHSDSDPTGDCDYNTRSESNCNTRGDSDYDPRGDSNRNTRGDSDYDPRNDSDCDAVGHTRNEPSDSRNYSGWCWAVAHVIAFGC
jgi:hypothetical protein